MPDIDTDFDDEGRQKVIDYVVQKYGQNQVAQIITYGGMAAKSSIRDVARVMDLPLNEADRLPRQGSADVRQEVQMIFVRPHSLFHTCKVPFSSALGPRHVK
jgi:DNA polymerase III alpha subunit